MASKYDKWRVGDLVTTKHPVPAYYSAYGGNPAQSFKPGMVGIIAVVKVPWVTRLPHQTSPYFVCVDFRGDNGRGWRVGLDYGDLVRVKGKIVTHRLTVHCTDEDEFRQARDEFYRQTDHDLDFIRQRPAQFEFDVYFKDFILESTHIKDNNNA